MSRPRTDDISLADALAFDSFTPEQKRIAFAGVAIHDEMEDRIERARREAFDDGLAAAIEDRNTRFADEINEQTDRLALAISMLPEGHSIGGELRDIRRKLDALVDELRHNG